MILQYQRCFLIHKTQLKPFTCICLIVAYEQCLTRLKAENICKSDTTIRPRKDTYLYDIDAVNEVLLNAFIHNDWNITEPLICFFDDRLEIISHGGLPGNQTKEQFYNGITKPRNAALMRIFHDLDIAEHNGHGIPTVVSSYGKDVFDIQDDYINVVIPFNKEVMEIRGTINGNGNGNGNDTLSPQEEKIVQSILVNSKRTFDEFSAETGFSKRTISRIFKSLQNKGIVKRVGATKGGYWQVIK